MVELGKNQEKLLKWMVNKTTWKSIPEITKKINVRLNGNQIRSSLNSLVKKGYMLKEKGENGYLEYKISIFGKQWCWNYKYTLPILKWLADGPRPLIEIVQKFKIGRYLALKNLVYLKDYDDITFSSGLYRIAYSGTKKLESIK